MEDQELQQPHEPIDDKNTRKSSDDHSSIYDDIKYVAQEGHAVRLDENGKPVTELNKDEEDRLRRKIDWHIVPPVFLLYIWCFMDRSSIGNAKLAGLERDLGMSGDDYNIALTVFFVSYTLIEIPSQICCKIVGPGRWLPLCAFFFGLITVLTIYAKSYSGLIAIRFFLGIAEGAMMPGIAFYLSRWYRKDELIFRLALYIVAAPLAGAFGGLLAAAILTMDSIGWITEWRMIFFVEGLITVGVAIFGFFAMTASPSTARWLNDEEKALAAFRVKSENAASTVVVDKINSKAIKAGIFNINTIIIGIIFLFDNIMVQGLGVFLPTIIKVLYPNSTVVQSQLRSVPPNVVGAVFTLAAPLAAWKFGQRGYTISVLGLFAMVGYAMFLGSRDAATRYGAAFLCCAGCFPLAALCNGWASNNTSPDSARAVSIGTVVMMGNIGGLVSAWGFTSNTAPDYIPGNALNLGGATVMMTFSIGLIIYQKRENLKRKRGERNDRLHGKSENEVAMLGHKHPQFLYVH